MIAGLPQAPSQYNPLLNPRAALARRNEVLQAMEQQGDITASEYAGRDRPGPRPQPGTASTAGSASPTSSTSSSRSSRTDTA